jgi:predicted metal-dependent hydrolase
MAKSIIDELIRSRRKTVSLMITKEARLVVRAPLRLPLKDIEKFVYEKREWIHSKKSIVLKRLELAKDFQVKEGGQFLFLGHSLTLVFSDKIKNVMLEGQTLLVPINRREEAQDLIKRWYHKQAKVFLEKRLIEISQITGIPFQASRITSARRRWGSCNSRNHINLTWRLIMANQSAIDYVIIHELCHVVHKNHSMDFWNKVRELMGGFNIQRKWLKENSYILDVLD